MFQFLWKINGRLKQTDVGQQTCTKFNKYGDTVE